MSVLPLINYDHMYLICSPSRCYLGGKTWMSGLPVISPRRFPWSEGPPTPTCQANVAVMMGTDIPKSVPWIHLGLRLPWANTERSRRIMWFSELERAERSLKWVMSTCVPGRWILRWALLKHSCMGSRGNPTLWRCCEAVYWHRCDGQWLFLIYSVNYLCLINKWEQKWIL